MGPDTPTMKNPVYAMSAKLGALEFMTGHSACWENLRTGEGMDAILEKINQEGPGKYTADDKTYLRKYLESFLK